MKKIGERLKYIRVQTGKNQNEIAGLLGVSVGHVSRLERDLKTPSEQLILNVCRTFRVSRRWLEEGKGDPNDDNPSRVVRGVPLFEEIERRFTNGLSQVSLGNIARLVGIDVENFPDEREKVARFAIDDMDIVVRAFVKIFQGKDRVAIDAVKSTLQAFASKMSTKKMSQPEKIDHRKSADASIRLARFAEKLRDYNKARTAYLEALDLLRRDDGAAIPGLEKELGDTSKEYQEFIRRDPIYNDLRPKILSIIDSNPGILLEDLSNKLPEARIRDIDYVVDSARASGEIEEIAGRHLFVVKSS